MSVDDVLARHRPTTTLPLEQRERMLAAVVGHPVAAHDGTAAAGLDEADEVLISVLDLDLEQRPPTHSRRRWLLAAAAAAVVLACAGGLLAWRAPGSDRDGNSLNASATAPVCRAALPAGWKAAYATTRVQIAGHTAAPAASDATGHLLLSWKPSPTTVSYGFLTKQAAVTVASFAASADGESGWHAEATDGDHVVFGYTAKRTSRDAPPTTDLMIIDVASKQRTHLVAASPAPKGWDVRSDVVVQNGYVYWGTTPRGDDKRGMVVRYSIADRTYRTMADLQQFPYVIGDVRGVAWPGGSAPLKVPTALNPLLSKAGIPVDRLNTDGSSYSWQLINGDQMIIRWVDTSDQVRVFRIAALNHGSDSGSATAVAGPFVFLHVNAPGHSDSVLDTRTGAIAPLKDGIVVSYPGHHVFALGDDSSYYPIDAAKLPKIHC